MFKHNHVLVVHTDDPSLRPVWVGGYAPRGIWCLPARPGEFGIYPEPSDWINYFVANS